MSIRAALALLLVPLAEAQKGSPFRCRDRDPQCETWKGRGECTANHDFMAESCPQSCDYCENGGLMPTPSHFQLDLVCKDQLAINPKTYKGGPFDDLPANWCVLRSLHGGLFCVGAHTHAHTTHTHTTHTHTSPPHEN